MTLLRVTILRLIYAVPIVVAVVVGVGVWWLTPDTFTTFYEDKMRASLFTGFFTLSGFLLSAKTFIILNLKKEMFSTKTYLKRVKEQRALAEGGTIKVYRPLRNIGHVLLVNVALCLLASILQFTLGLVGSKASVAVCLAVASAAGAMLVFSLVVISRRLHDMYEHFEEDALAEMDAPPPGPPPGPSQRISI